MTGPAETWLPVPVAARRLELSERRIWSLVSEGTLESVLVGGRRLIDPAAIAALREKKKKGTEVQWQLQSESVYDRLVRLEKNMHFVLKELENGR